MAKTVRAMQSDGFMDEVDPAFRETLVNVVNDCLKQKPEEVPTDEYFEEHIEPILSKLAVAGLSAQPEHPAAFVNNWQANQQSQIGFMDVSDVSDDMPHTSPIATMANLSWKQKQMEKMESELGSLRLRYDILKQALQRTHQGREAVRAAERGDQQGVFHALGQVSFSGNGGVQGNSLKFSDDQLKSRHGQTVDLSSPANRSSEAANEQLGVVLRCLRERGVTSASSAFTHFRPDQDSAVPRQQMQEEIQRMGILTSHEVSNLLDSLDATGCGKVHYQDFRSAVVGFLSSSRDFHSALSPEEFNAIMYRIQNRIQMKGQSLSQFFSAWDANQRGFLETREFLAGLRSLRLGLSGKEVAQIFNSLRAESYDSGEGGALQGQGRMVNLEAFKMLVEQGAQDVRLKDWATGTFARFRHHITAKAVEQHADSEAPQHLAYTSFVTFLSSSDPAMTPPEIGKLWSLLDKEDSCERPLVRLEEVLRWLEPQEPTLHSSMR